MNGTVVSGEGRASEFVAFAADELADALAFAPYYGTLNITDWDGHHSLPSQFVPEVSNDYCAGIDLYDCRVNGVRSAVIVPHVPDYPDDKVEVLAPVHLRTLFDLEDGDCVDITPPSEMGSSMHQLEPTALDEFGGVVFDLDGTLIDLAVDWRVVETELTDLFGAHLEGGIRSYAPNELHGLAVEVGKRAEFNECLATHETAAVEASKPLALLDVLAALDCPVGICTLNAVAAANRVLDHFDCRDAVDVIVGRETLVAQKPHPAPLRRCFEKLNVAAGSAVFVGDEVRDAETAVRAETSFLDANWVN
ncbi:DUF120 domain-containing protein [Haladaptatus sp. CMSO5]|uniref:DUF120 domain-containing protein n=1 Tax=Haladaptatus sp. CMSO5 TaxID=3120514 RepID=UPI002FCE4088